MRRNRWALVAGFFALGLIGPAGLLLAQTGTDASELPICTAGPARPDLDWAYSAALLDATTGAVLYSSHADDAWAPASLTKVVTLAVALDAARAGDFSLDRRLPVDRRGWASSQEPGSSLMFLGPDQLATGEELLQGLMIASGNDAAVEIAVRVAGSVGAFAARMNAWAYERGLRDWYFEEPAGLSPANRITALGYVRMVADMIAADPTVVDRYFSAESFAWPIESSYPEGMQSLARPIVQYNRNALLGSYEGADGIKTGFIEASGYNLAASAERDGRRLVAVVLGVEADSHVEGGRRRTADAQLLLDWGFEAFRVVEFVAPQAPDVTVWGGRLRSASARVLPVAPMTLPLDQAGTITGRMTVATDVWAPTAAGHPVGTVEYRSDDCVVVRAEIVLDGPIERGGLLRRVVDRIRWWWRSLTARASS